MPDLQRGEVRCQRVGAVDDDLSGQVAARADCLLGALPRGAQHYYVAVGRGVGVGGDGRPEVGVLRVVGGANAEGDVVVGSPSFAESASDVSGSDDGDLHWGYSTAVRRVRVRPDFEVPYAPGGKYGGPVRVSGRGHPGGDRRQVEGRADLPHDAWWRAPV